MTKKEKAIMTVRLDKSLRDSFTIACSNNDLPASIVLRELIKSYVKSNSQMDILKNSNPKN